MMLRILTWKRQWSHAVSLSDARFHPILKTPDGVVAPPNASARLSITLAGRRLIFNRLKISTHSDARVTRTDYIDIIGVQQLYPARILDLLQGQAGVLAPLRIQVFQFTAGIGGKYFLRSRRRGRNRRRRLHWRSCGCAADSERRWLRR